MENRRDYTFVEVSRNNGRTYDILDVYTGSSSGWKLKQYSLSSYLNEPLVVRFRSTTDTSTLVEGFYVDDIYPVSDFDTVKTLSDSTSNHYYIVPGNPVGQYYYRVEGYNSRGWGDFSKLKMIDAQFSAHPPYTPSNPSPENNSDNINVSMDLFWDGGDMDRSSIVYYNVSFGTTNPPSFQQRIGPYPGNQTRVTYDPGVMSTYTQYYWQILANDNDPASNNTLGPIWTFRAEDNLQPEWRNQGQSVLSIPQGDTISLYAQGKDNVALKKAYLATNETGVWLSYDGAGWWDANWDYCKRIVINHDLVDADMTNFPVLIACTSSDFAAHAQPDGNDFVFVDAANTTKYNHEIESYTSATEELVAWVNVPFVSASEDTVLYVYYGNPDCGNQENSIGTWDSNFIMIDHLTGVSSADLKDSSSNHWDITSTSGNPSYNQIGKAGRCVDFDGVDDSLQTNLFRLPTDSSYTGSAWVYVDGNTGKQRYIFEGVSANLAISLLVWTNESFKNYAKTDSGGATASSYSATQVNAANPQWYYVCTRVNAVTDDLELIVNGVIERSVPITGLVNPETNGLNIGTSQFASTPWMSGKIDEIRISNMVRSDAWLKAEYNNMVSPATFAAVNEEISRGGGVKYGSPMNLTTVANEWVWSNFTWQNPDMPTGRLIGWRIYYVDTNGNTIATDVMSFQITTQPQVNPPTQPTDITAWHTDARDMYKGTGGYPGKYDGQPCTYQSTSTETGSDLYFTFYWGDTTNTVVGLVSGSASATHIYALYGYYDITVTVKRGVGGTESDPSTARSVHMFKSGDTNSDGSVSWRDIDPFVTAMSGQSAYYAAYPTGYFYTGDCNFDRHINWRDIDPFVARMNT